MISFARTPNDALAFYKKNGFFIEEAVLTEDECKQAIEMGLNLEGFQKEDFRPCMQPHRQNPDLLKFMKKPSVVAIMKILLNGEVDGLQTEFFYTVSGTRGFSAHQDNFFVEAPSDNFASAWMSLTDVSLEKGSLYGYPGSHLEGKLPTQKLERVDVNNQDPNSNNEETIVPAKYKKESLTVQKGSIIFLHGEFVHGSNPNLTSDPRYVLLCTYIKRGSRFRPGQYAVREPILLEF
jgi:ectoine hydroxylase-related dioxygenase (phytanoyl-CoA dioxygenase family)